MIRAFLLFLALCAALFFGGAELLEFAAAFTGRRTVYEVRSIDEVKQSAGVPERRVVKLSPKSEALTDTSMDGIVDEFLRNAAKLEKEFKIDIKNYSEDEVTKEFLALGLCHSIAWTSSGGNNSMVITVKPEYRVLTEISYAYKTGGSISDKAQEVYDIAKNVISDIITADMTDFEKELKIHDFLIQNAAYDSWAASLDDVSGNKDSFSAYGVLTNKMGVCQAYTEAMSIFMLLLGIECAEVSGEAGGLSHTWNIVKLDGEYYHVDVTWDDPVPDKPGEVSRAYFNLTDEMILKDHIFEANDLRCVSDKYNYFRYNGLVAESAEDFERLVTNAINNNEPFAELRLSGIGIDDMDFGFASRLTGLTSFTYTETQGQNVVKVYIGLD